MKYDCPYFISLNFTTRKALHTSPCLWSSLHAFHTADHLSIPITSRL
jgi:hypothetical protein